MHGLLGTGRVVRAGWVELSVFVHALEQQLRIAPKDQDRVPTGRSEKRNPRWIGGGKLESALIRADLGTSLFFSLSVDMVWTEFPYMNSPESQIVLKPCRKLLYVH